ncbi:replication factor A protein 1-like [Chenopodium quinoa]|uniref:replication factor A protein 1-like n=1 Tax=Chenopodium quinoa TaxID=63459 RepID=UPI000B78127C|nr:replication factor A protein 1-like [Chenopodium quinoa]
MAFTMISDLTPLKESWRIKARIVRLWYQPDYSNIKKINSLELILVDEKGSNLQATIEESLIRRFEGLVKKGTSRIISSFGMITNAGKHLAHAYKVNFYYRTIVRDCEDAQLPQYRFDFVSFDKILKQHINEVILVDVIGELTGMDDLINISKTDTPNNKLTIELEDLHKNKLTGTLYGKYAEQPSDSPTKDDIQGPIVVVLQFARLRVLEMKFLYQIHYGRQHYSSIMWIYLRCKNKVFKVKKIHNLM